MSEGAKRAPKNSKYPATFFVPFTPIFAKINSSGPKTSRATPTGELQQNGPSTPARKAHFYCMGAKANMEVEKDVDFW